MLKRNVLAFEQLHGTRCEDVRRFCNFVLSSQHSLSGGITPPLKRSRPSPTAQQQQQPTAQQQQQQQQPTAQQQQPTTQQQQPTTQQQHTMESSGPPVKRSRQTASPTTRKQTTNQLASPPSTPLTASTTFNGLQTPATLPTQKHGQTRSAYLEEHGKDYFDKHGQTLADAMEFHEKNKGPTRAPPNTEDPAFKTPSTEKIPRKPNGVPAQHHQNGPQRNLESDFDDAANTTDGSDAGEANTTNQDESMAAYVNQQRANNKLKPI